ncbi:hypothetical protein FPSE_11247 [Fusarium pseudograminearum CS3096]|uniref:Hypervirulence associated protein TUDOR domain-containing protein n=1 Tax=Fusarium pseudograminearum (strain CS3096) TaxID=1028729 RepID=K3V5Q3_FUSPC|nr:hypothetical protein FPSE_11247 [Fusarium pseudograminearum CS3096]EKJ68577.1 hypothetical protein FPSE_11247 [Fusarium pseudograminearum CS3096]KAF0635782.1 hypothetical protein FPSE5266_11247 [Fusarium pseudograminearum]
MKGNDEVIQEFNEVVNMTASELEKWLKSDDSNSAGWPKEDENGESVGHDSGRKIVEILKENPKKEPSKYTDEQIQHMRKVVSYCNRHLAQETKSNNDKSPEEVKKTKSYASLKNWGHDFLKAQGKDDGSNKKQEEEKEEKEEEADDDAEEEQEDGDDEKQTGEKRRATRSQTGSNKKRETRKGESTKSNDEDEEEEEEGDDADEKPQKKQSNGKKTNGASKKSEEADDDENDDDEGGDGSGPKKGPKKGETVSWNWGEGQPKGKVLDVKAEDTSITTKNGNTVSRKGDEEDPAVVLDTGNNKAIKKAHELN